MEFLSVISSVVNLALLALIFKTLKDARMFVKDEIGTAITAHNKDETAHAGIREILKKIVEVQENHEKWVENAAEKIIKELGAKIEKSEKSK